MLGAALARAGEQVVFLMREASLAGYPGRVEVVSQVLGDFTVAVAAASMLDVDVVVVWGVPKATELASALELVPPGRVGGATVIPLMNGIDHVAVLRSRFATVVAGTMQVASQRVPGPRILQTSPFARVDLAGAPQVAAVVAQAGFECHVASDEATMMWQKLVFLAPLALATTAADAALGAVRDDELYLQASREAVAVAESEGAVIDIRALAALQAAAPDAMRSSMQRDVAEGRVPELDAIAGPILRAGAAHAIPTPAMQQLVDQVRAQTGPGSVRRASPRGVSS